MPEKKKKLSNEYQIFISAYIRLLNGTRAYMEAYPKASYDAARANAPRLLATDSIAEEIEHRLAGVHMSADEALKLLADQARGDMGDFVDIDENGSVINLNKAKDAGQTKLLKKLKQKTIIEGSGEDAKEVKIVDMELYDSQAALNTILKIHGKLTDKVDLTSGGLPIKGYIGISPDDWDKVAKKDKKDERKSK